MFLNPSDIKVAYMFLRHSEATPANLQLAHREAVMEQLHQAGRYLLIEDTSEMSWSGNQPVPGLGSIGNGAPGFAGLPSALGVGRALALGSSGDRPLAGASGSRSDGPAGPALPRQRAAAQGRGGE